MIDFSDSPQFLRTYSGASKKYCITYNDDIYMLKFPDPISEKNKLAILGSSYENNSLSEYLSCKIVKSIGIPVQDVLIGKVQNKIVVACKDFTSSATKFADFASIGNTCIDSHSIGKIPKIEDLYYVFSNSNMLAPIKEQALQRYWDTFIVDAFLGNFDRHAGNWGYLTNEEKNEISLAPIFDCGSCLYPRISDLGMEKIIKSPEEIEKRIFKFPNAALEVDGTRANYVDFISSSINTDCNKALLRTLPKISMNTINNIIDSIEEISDIRKCFYKTILAKRYDIILSAPYHKLLKETTKEPSMLNTIKGLGTRSEKSADAPTPKKEQER